MDVKLLFSRLHKAKKKGADDPSTPLVKYIKLGERQASVIGLGAWQFGTTGWGWGRDFGEKEAQHIVQRALELGINFFDTAEIYANGRSEAILGRALQGQRNEAIIATKVWLTHLTRAGVRRAVEASLQRLGVDTIDLYQVHGPNPVIPLSWTMAGMKDLLDRGLIRHAGVSNFSLARWRRAEDTLGASVVSDQVEFHLLARQPLEDLLPYAQQHGRVIIAYSPLGQGVLTGKYTASTAPGGVRTMNPLFSSENLRRITPLIDVLNTVAQSHGATAGQVALAWLIHQPQVIAIPGAKSPEQVEANATAADIDLSQEEWERIQSAARRVRLEGRVRSIADMISRFIRA